MSEFVPVPGFEQYLVSKDCIFLNRRNRNPLKLTNEKSGQYPKVKFNGKRYNAHRLIAKAFIPNPLHLPMVNHKDGDKFNLTIDNLEWCTNDHNMKHAQITGLLVRGTQVHTNILDELQVIVIKDCIHMNVKQKYLAEYFKVGYTTINKIKTNKNWKHVTSEFAQVKGYQISYL